MVTEMTVNVRYPECDMMGVVHHAVYPIWYEQARMDYFAKCGYDYTATKKIGVDPAMVNLELSYGAPLSFPATVTIKTKVTLCEGKKLAFLCEVWPEGAEKPSATAKSFHIWVKDGKSYNLEQEQPEIFAAYRAGME